MFAAAVGGAVTGAITTANPAAAVGAAAGAVVESLINDVGTKPPAEVVKNAVIDGATSAAFSWAGGKIATKMKGSKLPGKVKSSKPVTAVKNSKPVTSVTNSKLVTAFKQIQKQVNRKVNRYNLKYKLEMQKARNAWKKDRTVINLSFETVQNGILGQLPSKARKTLRRSLNGYTLLKKLVKHGLNWGVDQVYEVACIV